MINSEGGENNIVKFSDRRCGNSQQPVHDVTYARNVSYSVIVEQDPPGFPELDSFENPKAITLSGGTVITAYERHSWEGNSSASWLGKKSSRLGHGANPATVGSDYSENPALGKLNNGNIVVVWEDGYVGGGEDNIVGQLIPAGRTKIGGEFTVNSSRAHSGPGRRGADGRAIHRRVGGHGRRRDGSAIKGQVFTSSGVKSGEEFTVNTSTTDDQKSPTVTALANGDAFVTWTDYDGATSDIYSQVINLQSYVGDGRPRPSMAARSATLSTAAPAPTSCTATAATTYSRTLRLTISTTTFSTVAPAPIRSIWTTMSRSFWGRRCCSAPTAP